MLALHATARKEATLGQSHRLASSHAFSIRERTKWAEHFRFEGAAIRSLTAIGEVTARIFSFNDSARLHEREEASSQ